MHTYMFSAEVIVPEILSPFLKEDFPLTWEETMGDRPDPKAELQDKISDLLHREMIAVAGDREDFTLGDPLRVSMGTYEFWFTYQGMNDADKELDVVEVMNEDGDHIRRLYVAGVENNDRIGIFIKTAALQHEVINVEDDRLPRGEEWAGTFKIVLTMKKKR